jgi:hypothetical protein
VEAATAVAAAEVAMEVERAAADSVAGGTVAETVEVVTAAEVREEARAMEVAGAAVAAACMHGTSRIEHWQPRSAGRSQCTGRSRS